MRKLVFNLLVLTFALQTNLLSQKYLGWIRLDPETYYVNVAPVSLNFGDFIWLNLGFLAVSSLLLWIPSLIISNINPARVLRFR